MKHKIMFINAIDPSKEIEIVYPPLGFGYLVSSLRENFGQDYFDFKIVERDIEQAITDFKPDIIGITSVSQNYNKAIQYAKLAKKYSLPVIIGGVHISALPFTITEDMDIGVIGEGEQTIVELFNLFENKGYFDITELGKIKGIIFFKKDGKPVVTEKRELIRPLDKIQMPARDMYTIGSTTYMFTSRGCPYRCTFCASTRFWNEIRFFSAEYVVNEIKYLVEKHHVKHINFLDDLFIADKKRLKLIVELLEKEGLLNKVDFTCNVRSNLVDDELCQLLKRLNVESVSMGLESGVPATLEYLKGLNINVNDHKNAIKILKKYRIKPNASFIIGSPKETRDDILQTFRFIKENNLNSFDVYVLTPFPGTPVWEYAKEKNLVTENMNWNTLNVNFGENYRDAVIVSETLTREDIYKLFLLFTNEKTKMLIKNVLRNPFKLIKYHKSALIYSWKMFTGKPLFTR
jgi:radical SAM superfamily enzyme YgiQ (UPF0313 family)